MNTPNIGLVGYAGSGKDTIYSILSNIDGFDSHQNFKFAWELKVLSKKLFNIPLQCMEDNNLKNQSTLFLTEVKTMESHFFDFCRGKLHMVDYQRIDYLFDTFMGILQNHPDIITHIKDGSVAVTATPRTIMQVVGTDFMRSYYDENVWIDFIKNCGKFICTDVRFPNEAKIVKSLGGILIRVKTPDESNRMNHPSEMHIPTIVCDYEIMNQKRNLDELSTSVMDLLKLI